MKIRRNEPCPCGSGKKYKKCCLKKEEQTRRDAASEARSAARPPAPATPAARLPARELDPREEAAERLWTEFEKGDYERKIALFSEALGDAEVMDAELAFEMLNTIEPETVERGERDRFDALVETARERRPELYKQNVGYWGSSLLTNALAAGKLDRVTPLTLDMAEDVGKHIDMFERALEQLAFHNQREALLAAHRKAWPKVVESDDIMGWAIDTFGNRTIDYEIFDYLESTPDPDPDDPDLRGRLESYEDIRFERVAESVSYLLGRAERDWTGVSFEIPRREQGRWVEVEDEEDEEEEEEHREKGLGDLFALSLEFLGWVHREEGVPYAPGELGRAQIVDYILERGAGDLDPSAETRHEVRRKDRRSKPEPRAVHPLCPDRATLDRYLAGHLQFLNFAPYQVAATFELMPAWVRFLEKRGLIDASEREHAERELEALGRTLADGFGRMQEDPALRERTEKAIKTLAK